MHAATPEAEPPEMRHTHDVVVSIAETGPARPPEDPKDWPGVGAAGVYDLWTERRMEFWDARARDRGAVVFFGDSITHQWANLREAFPELKTANRGIGGDSSRRLILRLKEDVLDLRPAAVIILIGINDLLQGRSAGDVAGNLRLILEGIRAEDPLVPVVLCHILPCDRCEDFPERIHALNALMDDLARNTPGVFTCDTWPGLALPDGMPRPELFPDGLHMAPEGYAGWANNLRPVLEEAGLIPVAESHRLQRETDV